MNSCSSEVSVERHGGLILGLCESVAVCLDHCPGLFNWSDSSGCWLFQ